MAASIVISNTPIGQDEHGRYCLNHLHRAAGGQKRNRPTYWLTNAQTQELIAELGGAGNPAGPVCTVNDGKNNGTYAAKELVYAYAMWISPKFHLHVIRAFDQMSTQVQPVDHEPTTELWGRLLAAHEQLSQRDEKIINLLQAQQQDLRGQVAKLTQQVERLSGKVITTQAQLVKAQTYTIDLVAGRMSGAEASSVIIDMERRGESRERIREVTGRTYNNIRQAIHQARLRGDLPLATKTTTQPQQSALDLEGAAHA